MSDRPAADPDAIVVGAGWAGLAAALTLVGRGQSVVLLDAAPQAGGRAREQRLHWDDPDRGPVELRLDNGQHLLIGAYDRTLTLLGRLGALQPDRVQRRPLRIANAGGLRIARPRFVRDGAGEAGNNLLAPLFEPLTPLLALAGARGLALGDRWAIIATLLRARARGWRLPPTVRTVADWYRATGQSAEAVRLLWQPLVISTLNTPAEAACAATFLHVLRDSLGGPAAATDFVLPQGSLGAFFVDPVLAGLQRLGGRLLLRQEVRRIETGDRRRYRVVAAGRAGQPPVALQADRLVLATPPRVAARLLDGLAPANLKADLARFDYYPITTAYFGWPHAQLPDPDSLAPVLALQPDPQRDRHAHWLFDRGRHGRWRVGALVISDSRAAQAMAESLGDALARQLTDETGLPAPEQITLIHEKRATFACTPERPRLQADSAIDTLPGLALAGDYAWPDYPATLEGAVRSGLAAAALLDDQPPRLSASRGTGAATSVR